MFGYNNFSDDVLSIFDTSFCRKHAFTVIEKDNDSVKFESTNCTMFITIDGLIVEACFLEPEKSFLDNEYYPRSLFLEFRKKEFVPLFHNKNSKVIECLSNLRISIESLCLEIIDRGDFSWKKEFDVFLANR